MVDHAAGCAIGNGVSVCTCGAIRGVGGIHVSAFIHPKAHVDETCGINADVKVWQFASVTRGTVLGEGCSVAPFALLDGPKIGDRCIISMHVAMGPGFEVGNDCFIGPSVVFCNDAWPSADKTGWDAEMLRDGRCVTIRMGDRAGIGAGAVILPGVTLGEGSFVAAGAVCDRDVPANHLFKRDGTICEINTAWAKRRMRAAGRPYATGGVFEPRADAFLAATPCLWVRGRPTDADTPPFGLIVSGEAA